MNRVSKAVTRFLMVMTVMTLALYGTNVAEAKVTEHSRHNTSLLNSGTTWYIATNGVDSPTCYNPASPCKTLGKAIDNAVDGDTLLIAIGTYPVTSQTQISKDLYILGGWASDFSAQTGFSTFTGGGGSFEIFSIKTNVTIERLMFQKANHAIFVWTTASVILRQISVTDMKNTAIMNDGPLTIINSTLSNNHGGYGAIYNYESSLTLLNTTIINNSSKAGQYTSGGVNTTVNGTTSIQNSIIAGNYGSDGQFLNCGGIIHSLGHNILGWSCTIHTHPSDITALDEPKLNFVPTLGYIPLSADSPAVDFGDPAACPPLDQRGMIRPQGSACDAGAYEYSIPGPAASLIITNGNNQIIGPGLSFNSALAVYALDAFGTPAGNVDVTFSAPESGASGIFTDSGTNTITVSTDSTGLATTSIIANSQLGSYNVLASLSDSQNPVIFDLTNGGWFVTPNGSDSNSCTTPEQACITINAAVTKAVKGGSIQVSGGTYTSTSTDVVSISKRLILSGGWNANFTLQNEESIIDGQEARRGLTVNSGYEMVVIDHFTIEHAGGQNTGVGIYNLGSLTVSHSIIRNNTVRGAIYSWGGRLTLNDSIITKNASTVGIPGSGISVLGESAIINNSSIINNTGNSAIYLSSGTLNMTNSTVGGNLSGGIEIADGMALINYSTITDNSGPGGVFGNSPQSGYTGTIKMQNSILAGNKNTLFGGDCYGIITSSGYNIIGNNTNCSISSGPGDKIGTKTSPVNPMISSFPMKPYGQYILFAESPAIDAANPSTCPVADQRNITRPIGGNCDIGSFEHGATPGGVAYFDIYSGNNQESYQGRTFSNRLAVYAVDNLGTPVDGVNVKFTAPTSGASGMFSNMMSSTTIVQTSVNGVAVTPPIRANYEVGDFIVNAEINEVPAPVNFSLKNLQVVPNYLMNGNLEDPILGNYWWQYSDHFGTPLCRVTSCGTGGPHSGNIWARFGGGPDYQLETAAIAQYIIIPKGPAPTYLQFYLWIVQSASADNELTVTIDSSSTPIFKVNATQKGQYYKYKPIVLNLSQYADDKLHVITFRSVTVGKLVNFNIDDISLDVATFRDIPSNYWAWQYIDRLYNANVTGGCLSTPMMYCPEAYVNRAQMAVFILRAKHGNTYTPPAATGTKFTDVPANYWAAAWIEQLANEGVSGGCGNNKYCPEGIVTRDQMAIFLLRGMHGNTYTPPAASGAMFGDVAANHWAAAWIEALANEGVTGGCGNGNYCPATPVTRAQMAVFLVTAFGLP